MNDNLCFSSGYTAKQGQAFTLNGSLRNQMDLCKHRVKERIYKFM